MANMADDPAAMKIVFLLQDTGGVYGAERATIDLARGLIAAGLEVHALLIVETRLGLKRSRLHDAFAAAGVALSTVTTDSRFSRKLARDIADEFRRVGGTILHSTGYKADIHGLFAARALKVPQVSTVHGWLFRPDIKERFYAWLNVRAFKCCARVIALTSYYENLLRTEGVPNVVRIPTGMAVETPSPKPDGRPFTFGILGRLSWEKNHALLLDAVTELERRGVSYHLVIAGDGPLRASVESQIANRKSQITMPGYIPTAEFFNRVGALVICSRIENQPLVVMEAMARGVSVIGTNVGGIPDLVESAKTGLLVPSGDACALADAMAKFAGDPAFAARLGAAGRAKLAREFDPQRWIARHIELYREL